MKPKGEEKRAANPEVVSQLRQWAAQKSHLTLQCPISCAMFLMAGELHSDEEKSGIFFFTTWSREMMVTLAPTNDSQLTKDESGAIVVHLRGFGGEITITWLDSRSQLLLEAAPPSNRIQ